MEELRKRLTKDELEKHENVHQIIDSLVDNGAPFYLYVELPTPIYERNKSGR